MKIWCVACDRDIEARLTNGKEVYPHRGELGPLPFWICNKCKNSVGCHHKSKDRTKPLGVIAPVELKRARQHIHKILDPIWKTGQMERSEIYEKIAAHLGWDEYHTAEIRSLEDARKIYRFVREMAR